MNETNIKTNIKTKPCKLCKLEMEVTKTNLVYCPTCADLRRKIKLRRQYIYKTWVYTELGGRCADCGNADYRVLTIDHVNRDAIDDKLCWHDTGMTRDSRWYMQIWKHIKHNVNYPHDLQLLCMNCHMIKDNYFYKSYQEYCESRVAPLLMMDFKPMKKQEKKQKP